MLTKQLHGDLQNNQTLVVIPTYNEAQNLPTLVDQLFALPVLQLGILVVDDNSPDGTGKIGDALAERFRGRLAVRHRPQKQGLGRAYVDGFSCALDTGAEFIIQMDADFSHPVEAIPVMLTEIAQCDVVIGSRYVAGGRLDQHWGWGRRFLSWWANEIMSRRLLNLHTRDITAGFKCWRRTTLLGIGLERVECNGYTFQVEMTYLTERLGYRIREIPIYFEDRRIGQSKMDTRVKVQGALDIVQIWRRHRHAVRKAT